MAGLEIALFKEKLKWVSDYISGHSSISVINSGLEAELPKKWNLAVGAQVPSPGSGNPSGVILQLSKN